MDHTQIKQIVALFPCFSSLSSYDWQSAAIVRVDPSTRHPVMEGHFLEHAIFVIKGSIRIYKTNPLGREVTLYHIRDGQCCPLMLCSILGETEYEASAEIESNAEIFVVPVSLFHQWLDHHRPLKQFIFKQITEKVIDVTRLLDDIAFKSIQHRLAEYLLRTTAQGSSKLVIRMSSYP